MTTKLAHLSDAQHQQINELEQQLGVVLIAYDGYQQEDEQGHSKEQ
ncbi:hypothetical protein OS242_12880 [Tumebacillus sp. DT12]|uniref:Uncharacterized protein n=1 Tax=Tumebacillus lacus TaxID=2995335 RepID=A0ABT3X4F6_9BACL|nr:hypothetical protein [Tumebacillus lacus]MCX7570852.1 hypothetical protein [Tumebacillus lacus]